MLGLMIENLSISILVNDEMQRRVRAAAPGLQLCVLKDWTEITRLDPILRPSVMIVDPALVGANILKSVMERLRAQREFPVVLYAKMTPELPSILIAIANVGISRVILFGIDDDEKEIRAALVEALRVAVLTSDEGQAV